VSSITEVPRWVSLGSATRDEGDADVGGMAVEVLAAPVVDGRGSGVGVTGRDLDVPERDAGIEGCHDERGSQHVRVHGAEIGTLTDRADPSVGGSPVESVAVTAPQDRSLVALTDGQVDRPSRAGTSGTVAGFLPLPTIRSVRWPRSTPRSSMLVAQASLTRSPFRPNSAASAA
jgi:hypothetical protein